MIIPLGFRKISIILAGVFAALLFVYLCLAFSPFPELKNFLTRENSARIFDRNGIILQVLPLEDGLRREWLALEEIPARAQEVFIAAEDKNFYYHFGVDFFAVARAVRQNAASGRAVSGASTITMQLSRLIVPRKTGRENDSATQQVTLKTKFFEAVNAFRLEARLSKKQILELYLNSLPFGSNVEGIASAAHTIFGKTPAQLTDAQLHALAVLPRRPALYNPAINPEAALNAALEIGKTTGFAASRDEWLFAMSGAGEYVYPYLLPHFVRYATSNYPRLAPELHFSIDAPLSLEAELLIKTRIEENRDARITNGAALLIDNRTGEILVWAGSGDLASNGGEINGVLVKNQPGSAMKPFLYALALEMGFAPSSVLPDIPSDFGSSEVYVPLNFNNHYNGPVLLRNALASSLNVPAVYLLYRAGIDNYLAKLSELGFESLAGTRERTGLSLALGSGEVTLYEMVRAFSVFPRDGTLPVLTTELLNENNRGVAIYTKDTARTICAFLSDRRARASGFAFSSVLSPPYPAMFKTGTANQFQDIIALGATPRWTAGVWMGNFSGETVVGKTGSSIPAEVVRKLLDALTAQDERAGRLPENFLLPETYTQVAVCALSGLAPTDACPSVTHEFVKLGLENALAPCAWHVREGGRMTVRYPGEYQRWWMGKNTGAELFGAGEPLAILYPANGAIFVHENYAGGAAQQISVDCAGGNADTARLYVNGAFFGESARPFSWNVPLAPGGITFTVECGGESARIEVSVK